MSSGKGFVAAVDVGGTTIKMGFSENGEMLDETFDLPTPASFDEVLGLLQEKLGSFKVENLVIGVPGTVDDKGVLIKAPNLERWNETNIKKALERELVTKVWVTNDTALGGLGEAIKGAGKGYRVVGYLAIGTGVGGSRIVDGRIDKACVGFEPGHQIIKFNGRHWHCGQRGCLEAYVSGRAFKELYGISPKDCSDDKIWREYSNSLGQGIVNLVAFWSPDVVVVGGGLSQRSDEFLPMTAHYLKENPPSLPLPRIVPATLGKYAGVIGALEYLKCVY